LLLSKSNRSFLRITPLIIFTLASKFVLVVTNTGDMAVAAQAAGLSEGQVALLLPRLKILLRQLHSLTRAPDSRPGDKSGSAARR
jgi:hypothetical protein